ncbi:g6842 [Coccomyxa elongata]
MRHLVLVLVLFATIRQTVEQRDFTIENDQFHLDGKPFRIISGSLHYHRIHPAQWKDRMLRTKALGLNTLSVYVPWNLHEPFPGQYNWEGFADLEAYLALAQQQGLYVLLRPGPYICAEWDFGGFPWWLASSKVIGQGKIKLRSDDPVYLTLVDRWWNVLLPKIGPFLYKRGGNILMVQVENEFGFVGPNEKYMRHLVGTMRASLGDDALIYTTDPPPNIAKGSLPGDEVFSVIDFGAGWFDLNWAFSQQRAMNPPGKSPPMCSEFYTGWLTRWGEPMANTSVEQFLDTLHGVLGFANNTGSVNLYMVHGGTNFGFTAGGSIDNGVYWACITSYDYDAPISEAGDIGQPGIGGPNKYDLIRAAIKEHTGVEPPQPPQPPRIEAYGDVGLYENVTLRSQIRHLYPGDGVASRRPLIMEEYGLSGGLIVYRTSIPAAEMTSSALLDVAHPVHDAATVLLDGVSVGRLSRNGAANLTLDARSALGSRAAASVMLEIVVEAVGRSNQGWRFDTKGLSSPNVRWNGKMLEGWRVFPLPLDNLQALVFHANDTSAHAGASAGGPTFFRGYVDVDEEAIPRNDEGVFPDSYLYVGNWGKGVAFVNGFNLGWYWPSQGPANTMYVPGPILKAGVNEVILLEVEKAPAEPVVTFQKDADFYGPKGKLQQQTAAQQRLRLWRGESAAESAAETAAHPQYADWARLMQQPQSLAAAAS